jgi:uncharacterized protein (TIGR00725 family)
MSAVARGARVAVVGSSAADPGEMELAWGVGVALADAGAVVLCGGRRGVMEAVCRGVAEAGGLCIGVLPGSDAREANPWVGVSLPTGLGEARNAVLVTAAEAVIAVGGGWGTLSEIALALKAGRSVTHLGAPPAQGMGLHRSETAADAAAWAVREASAYRAAEADAGQG